MSEKNSALHNPGIIYEVNATLPEELQLAFLDWLHPHVEKMLSFSGFRAAHILTPAAMPNISSHSAATKYTIQYVVDDLEQLEQYFANHADAMRAEGVDKFGDALVTTRRILQPANVPRINGKTITAASNKNSANPDAECLDCTVTLTGQYCHNCGQRHQRKLVTVTELVGDLLKDLASWDSRFWRTIWPLLAKPGHLTNAYLQGQRMRYSPPLRMYLITSLLFFLAATIQAQLALLRLDVSQPITSDEQFSLGDENTDLKPGKGATASGSPAAASPDTGPRAEDPVAEPTATDAGEVADSRANTEKECAKILQEELSYFGNLVRPVAYQSCLKLTTREGLRNFALDLLDNLPKTMFLLLPLMALLHKIIYMFAKRYYVEHLLFFVHGYSFVFLFTTGLIGLAALSKAVGFSYFGWVIAFAVMYTAYYFFKSMRIVYRQSWWFTLLKWLLSNFLFLVLASFVLLLFTALTAAFVN